MRRRSRHGDSSNLVLWIAGVVCVLMLEPFAYFPQWFGIEPNPGPMIVHNQFSMQFLYERLPLYIVAMYPVFGYVAYVFTVGVPFALALATLLVSRRASAGGWTVLRNVVWVCLLIVSSGLVTVIAFTLAYRARRRDPELLSAAVEQDRFALGCVVVYLTVAAAIWIAALPDYLGAAEGRTAGGAPIGSLAYAVITFVLSAALTAVAYLGSVRRSASSRVTLLDGSSGAQ